MFYNGNLVSQCRFDWGITSCSVITTTTTALTVSSSVPPPTSPSPLPPPHASRTLPWGWKPLQQWSTSPRICAPRHPPGVQSIHSHAPLGAALLGMSCADEQNERSPGCAPCAGVWQSDACDCPFSSSSSLSWWKTCSCCKSDPYWRCRWRCSLFDYWILWF